MEKINFDIKQNVEVEPHPTVPNHSIVTNWIEGMPTHTRYTLVPDILVDELVYELKLKHQESIGFALDNILSFFKK